MKLVVNGIIKEYDRSISLWDISKEFEQNYYLGRVDDRLQELTYVVNKDSKIELYTLDDSDACRAYEATLRYIFVMAVNKLYPGLRIKFNYGISRSISCTSTNPDIKLSFQMIQNIKNELARIVEAGLPIKRRSVSLEEIKEYYKENKYFDKLDLLEYRKENFVHMYECEDYINYMFGYLLPNTSLLTNYNIFFYNPEIIIQYPRAELNGNILPFVGSPRYEKVLEDARVWGRTCKANSIAKVNKIVKEGNIIDFIMMCEARHNSMFSELANNIQSNINDIKIISIAGPSSSGKTTFSNRLRIELLSRGIVPEMISIDDYYKERKFAPLDSDGKPDLECIEALDIDLFNEDILSLIEGKEVTLPHFDFQVGKRVKGKTVKIEKNGVIIIEGIHALNDRLTSLIPRYQKYKIFISPQQLLNIDNENPIRITDIRLLRRMVRDTNYRNTSAEETLSMWSSVRNGEFKWVYDHQEDANYVFNSELTYELGVIRKYALPQLEAIPNTSSHYITANRLIKFLKYFIDIPDKYVPCNSLLREFIGGSCFYDK